MQPAALMLLREDVRIDGIEDAVRLSPAVLTRPGDPVADRTLTVDWKRVTRINRAPDVLVLAGIARSMLEGTEVDLSRLGELDADHLGTLAACFDLIARPHGAR